eukprot:CAMPEP_0172209912 /NCGR_PEP_ID=MMETSP1050-20130122/35413_1 /TAXON_ID=233186 /ORGANISM="Cryptomonas curvata, Strain CCAP979/52" /LENGTH=356 /DNA_ID=CAMNT_0012889911 /DNA_START=818 /DNA_END=1885 /DNA_ORIENTATION=+
MRAVFNTLEGSIGQAINICAVLTLFLVVFATIAVQLFGTTKFGQRLGSTANFYNVSSAMLTLIQILFGDELERIVDDCGVQPPHCTKAQENAIPGSPLEYSDCGSEFSILFFIAFTVVCDFTCMNLFVGMIIKNFVCCLDQEDSFLHIEDLRMISDIWTRIYDQQGSGFIPLHSIGRLLLDVPKPLGITGIQSKRKTYLCIREDLRRSCLHHSQSKCTEESLRSNEGYDRLGVRQFFHFLLRVEVYLASFIWKIPKITNSSALSSSNQEDGDLDGSTDVELECHGKTESREFTTKSVDEREDDALGNSGDFEFLEMLTGRSIHGPNSNTEIALSPDTFEENGSQVSVLVEMDINGN